MTGLRMAASPICLRMQTAFSGSNRQCTRRGLRSRADSGVHRPCGPLVPALEFPLKPSAHGQCFSSWGLSPFLPQILSTSRRNRTVGNPRSPFKGDNVMTKRHGTQLISIACVLLPEGTVMLAGKPDHHFSAFVSWRGFFPVFSGTSTQCTRCSQLRPSFDRRRGTRIQAHIAALYRAYALRGDFEYLRHHRR